MPTSWANLRVLVTGGKGFLGSHVIERLVQLGAETYGFARELPVRDDGIRWFKGELCDPATVQSLLKNARPDIVFHLAGQTVASPDRELVLPSFRNNLTATVVLMTELANVDCQRIVVTGSLEEPEPGDSHAVPTSPYGASKWAAVVYARMFHALYRLPVVIVRPYMTYGPGQRPNKLIPFVTLSLLRGQSPMISQPDRKVDWIYVDDVVDGILAAGSTPGVEGCTVDLGSGALVGIREISMQLQGLVGSGVAVRIASPQGSMGVLGRRADIDHAHRLLEWHAKTPLKEGLERTVAWHRAFLRSDKAQTTAESDK